MGNEQEWLTFVDEMDVFFPDLVILWRGEPGMEPLEFRIDSRQYFQFKKERICLDLFGDTESILVGSNSMTNKFMLYDRTNMKLGVANINCDQLTQAEPAKKKQRKKTRTTNAPVLIRYIDYNSLSEMYVVYCLAIFFFPVFVIYFACKRNGNGNQQKRFTVDTKAKYLRMRNDKKFTPQNLFNHIIIHSLFPLIVLN